MTWKIVADSGCDYRQLATPAIDTEFVSVPLTIQVADQVFIDDANLDIDHMMETMYATYEASKSACPSPDDYLRAFEGAKHIFVVTITGALSGSHNSAQLAKNIYLEEHPDTQIHVIDTLSAGGEVDLIVEKINSLIDQGLSYEEIVEAITAYQEKTKLLFVLAKVDNLVKNGRLSKLIGTVVGLLNIRMVGEASETGTLERSKKLVDPKNPFKQPMKNSSRLVMLVAVSSWLIAAMINSVSNCQNACWKPSRKLKLRFFQHLVSAVSMQKMAVC